MIWCWALLNSNTTCLGLSFFHRHVRNTNAYKHTSTGKWRPWKEEETGERSKQGGEKTPKNGLHLVLTGRYSGHFTCIETVVLRSLQVSSDWLEVVIPSRYPASLLEEPLAICSTAGRNEYVPRRQHHPLQPSTLLWTDSSFALCLYTRLSSAAAGCKGAGVCWLLPSTRQGQ